MRASLLGRFASTRAMVTYERAAEDTLQSLFDAFDTKIVGRVPSYDSVDATLSSGVLTLKCGTSNTIVINKQPPNLQLWFSSPISGPRRFNWNPSDPIRGWRCHRDSSVCLFALLESDLSRLFKEPIKLYGASS
ncbi:Mitochondrial matrix iron chaperone [Mitosporidium daphniae]|uniref:Ferroxidase n=1 Tax=Mitosporidium daphniae TaxID=1485682 RepID=A0A098VN33_9MICR|nr:uncharacterized protein DI09_6p320 [Mitosporidium daphniae]KGG50448.1 hypothetical protein DI09_6p320 [Mitosporidium daphniae]|eukprot:XP_013236875.1 uncharacterized protein DI09_6p320 [Mitosporidium daphniae]